MGSREKPLFDLNELPTEEYEEIDTSNIQPQKDVSSSTAPTSNIAANVPHSLVNNHAFSHASTVSGFQPFVRQRSAQETLSSEEIKTRDVGSDILLVSKGVTGEANTCTSHQYKDYPDIQLVEKEEGEWSDAEGSADAYANGILVEQSVAGSEKMTRDELIDSKVGFTDYSVTVDNIPRNGDKDESGGHSSLNFDLHTNNNQKNNVSPSSEGVKDDKLIGSQEGSTSFPKQRGLKGVEATHALRHANSLGKRPKVDQHKEAMLGKKRSRQTMFLNLEDVKQAGTTKASTPRRQNFPAPVTTRIMREVRITPSSECIEEKQQGPSMIRDSKQVDSSYDEGTCEESNDSKTECNGDVNSGLLGKPRRLNSATDLVIDVHPPSTQRSPWRQPADAMQLKSSQLPAKKATITSQMSIDSKLSSKKFPSKKQLVTNNQHQDTSVERLLREVTNEKMWNHTEESELQSVPGRFESVDEYVRVFEPLLFEECRAQLCSTWEELTETFSRDHIMVRVKGVERRERGWYDVIVLLASESKWTFKEGDVAVLSTPRPGTALRSKRDDDESEVIGRVAGTVRRYIPVDTRDPPGAILHFYVGDLYDANSKVENDHILRKLQPKGIWFLSVLGSLATTQREYVGLHAFRRLNSQMQNAILQPSPELFPKYEDQSPALPDCITPNFSDHLHRTFNGPQLSAIQWAAMHTAAGTSSGVTKTWPFTLVQGPPGTGKTHTVWGMLNVIHLVQYQHYYTALLKKLAPESYKQVSESNNTTENFVTGSIDDVLQSMDQNLFRTLPKLCPKPRMLVCAPSNAATDELLARVLDRGFIDGEMKVYRPDVARVGVDSQTRAAQAVSVERRTEQLLVKSRDEIFRWIHELKSREAQLSQQIASLQRDLNIAAVAGRSQGSVGVDPDILVARDQNRDALLQNLAAVVESKDKVLVEMSRLLILEGKFRPGWNFNLEDARANLEASFANEAEIVFTTVSSSGRKLFSRLTHGFDMVVIDEAAQASEVAILPPLSLGAARCVLVGDPQQLPATVISKAAGTLLYSRSLFERFQQAGCPTMLLSVQYRMHPQIRDFPSRYFYQGRLTDSDSISNLPDELYYKDPLLRPYTFFDITHGRESQRGGSVSYQNIHEAQFCFRLYEHLQKSLKSLGMGKVTVGIITPYKLQLKCLQREFENVLNSDEGKDIYINTVDAFQGQERDVIIMSCVRASNHGVGFVADIRRMNVALTRARRALWVMGNASALMKSEDWAALIKDSKTRNCYMDMDALPKEFMMPKAPAYAPLPSKIPPGHIRSFRSGVRHRSIEMLAESRSGTPSEDDEKLNMSLASSKNGSYRPSKVPNDNSLDDLDHHQSGGDKSMDVAWKQGIHQKKHNSAGPMKREL
ncbi:helicase sen1-like [Impatiens glandulifera]|uniref:helicase sen1-like n=1 Tax=Impatiens glandulifera TaxID=253017 RepID=UPI001FB14150|nr:helicase sen1-like [Impatiens glandulifera]XP_047315952.1 helicase sen1-like [Impatiens glandulifera]